MEYERVPRSEDPDDERRFRQRTLQRWRLSMLLSFVTGVTITGLLFPRISPCAPQRTVDCPVCPKFEMPDLAAITSSAAKQAVKHCPVCPQCPNCPSCPSCPPTKECQPPVCPDCKLQCPQVAPWPCRNPAYWHQNRGACCRLHLNFCTDRVVPHSDSMHQCLHSRLICRFHLLNWQE
eukprot:597639-Pleurochrysis_carterae.AAC.4